MTIMNNKTIGDYIVRKYTKGLEGQKDKTVYDLFQWKKFDVKLVDYKTNETLYDEKDLEFPEHYTQMACDIIAQKYFKRANVPTELAPQGKENSLKLVIHRMVKFWTEAGLDEGLLTEKTAKIFYDEVVYMMLDQRFAPNSPQWFNTGLKYYNTGEGSDGHFYYDIPSKKVVQSKDKYSRTQASACFILSIEDKLLGAKSITEQYVTETRLFKHGSGTGTNFSNIRAKGEKLTGGGYSSGVLSFLRGLDRNAGAIKSGGTTRRSAKMLQLDVNHPEILDYITWKSEQEDLVRALGKMGFDISFDGVAYDTVSGQNGNNTVRLDEEFMKKAYLYVTKGEDSDYELIGRVDKSINRKEKVSLIWNTMRECMWSCADPAPQFDATFNAWHTCPAGEDGVVGAKYNRINSTNPCAEYAFLDDTACNLASLNAKKFFNEETGEFDLELYKHSILLGQIVLEATIHWGQFPVEEVARRTHLFRTTGLGIANTASVHMLMGHAYDSDEARAVATSLMSIMTGYAYFTSSLMAQQLGAFEKYDINKEYMLEVIRNHARVSGARSDKYERFSYKPVKLNHTILHRLGLDIVSKEVENIWNQTVEMGEKYGFRNAQVTVIAPTGTIAFAMGCEATSIEPFFAHLIYKKLAGGGVMTIVNPLIPQVLTRLGYKEEDIQVITKQIENGEIENCDIIKPEHLAIFDTANKCGRGQRFIHAMGHVKMMACLTPMVSGAISKTVNLPKEASLEDMSNILIDSWKLGIKGISVYRDGSKASQPLNTSIEDIDEATKFEDFKYDDLVKVAYKFQHEINEPKRNKIDGIRQGTTHPAEVGGVKIYTTVNRREDGSICEIYITTDREGSIITGLLNSLSKSLSVMLQHHVSPKDIAKMLKGQQYEPNGFVNRHPYIKNCDSISDLISKIIEIELGDYSSCQVKPTVVEEVTVASVLKKIEDSTPMKPYVAKQEGVQPKVEGQKVYGKTCPTCGSDKMMKNGTCHVCQNCGSTTGCS